MIAPRSKPARSKPVGYVDRRRMYMRSAFFSDLGLGRTVLRQARRAGIELPTLRVGKMLLVDGADGIEFLRRVAEHQAGATDA